MKNKKGFAFIETIIIVVVLCSALLLLYSTYSAIVSDEKTRIYYDDPAFIYYTNHVKNFLEEYANLDNVKSRYFNNTYIVTIGTGFDELFYNTSYEASGPSSLEAIVKNFKINQIVLIKSKMYDKCFNGNETYCKESLERLSSYNMKKYVNSISDTSTNYILAIEYSFKLSDESDANGDRKIVSCTPLLDRKCKSFYASVGLN